MDADAFLEGKQNSHLKMPCGKDEPMMQQVQKILFPFPCAFSKAKTVVGWAALALEKEQEETTSPGPSRF